MDLSLVMIVKNGSKYLSRCFESVKSLVNEIIVVDTGSTDNSKEISKVFGAKIFDFKWNDNFAEARNFALQQSASNWNLILDADEYLDQLCYGEVLQFIDGNKKIGRIKRIDGFYQDGELKKSQSFISRILPKGVSYVGRVHEQVESKLPRVNTSIIVYHDGYLEQSDRSDRNIKLLKLELNENPKNDYTLYQLAKQFRLSKQYKEAQKYYEQCYAFIPSNAYYRPNFIVDYMYNIINRGNLEVGFQIIINEKDSLMYYPDFHFVSALFYMELLYKNSNNFGQLLPLIEKEYLRCLELGDTDKQDSVMGTGSFLASYNLGVFYETTGNTDKARTFYEKSAKYQYNRAIQQLLKINNKNTI